MRLKLTTSYIGTNYHGWQRQPDKSTIQAALEEAFFAIAGQRVSFVGSGRTDERVHAIAQVAHFDVDDTKNSTRIESLKGAFNYHLPQDIRVASVEQVDYSFNANKNAKSKTYIYDFYIGAQNALLNDRALYVDKDINIKAMQKAAKLFVGTHDFIGFRAKGSSATTTVRTVTECHIKEVSLYDSHGYRLTISASGFLYKMVRIIMGTLLKVGRSDIKASDIKQILEARQEWDKKVPVSPHGLYLLNVEYGQKQIN